jgi:hypothetical protein
MKLIILAVLGAFLLAACADRDPVVERQSEKRYQGKLDTKPWDNAPLDYGDAKWSKGDRASWETQLKARQLTQHEDRRIAQ